MKKYNEMKFILEEPEHYLNYKKKDLQNRLDEIEMSEEAIEKIKKENAVDTVKSKGLSLLGNFGEIITTILDWNESVNEDITEAKKAMLIAGYMNKADQQEESIEQLKDFLISPQGSTLFNKVLRILDDSPPDGELLEHLSSTLNFIISSGDFANLFDMHKYALSQIEKLSPQALSILSDYVNWPNFKKFEAFQEGSKIKEDFHNEMANSYCEVRGITDKAIISRVSHSVFELKRAGLIDARRVDQYNTTKPFLTVTGQEIIIYLNINIKK